MTFLSQLARRYDLTQESFASIIGVSRPTVAKMFRGETDLTLPQAQQLAWVLGITLEELVNKKERVREVILEESKKTQPKMEERISVPAENVEKFKQALLYITQKIWALPNVGQTVLYKILYFCDFDYYEKFEEQLIGARYIKNHFGPTPVEFGAIIKSMVKKGEIEEVKTKYFDKEQTKYLPVQAPDLSIFSGQELDFIDEVIQKHGGKTAKELSALSHKDVPWISTPEWEEIPYESVFYRMPETSVRTYDADL